MATTRQLLNYFELTQSAPDSRFYDHPRDGSPGYYRHGGFNYYSTLNPKTSLVGYKLHARVESAWFVPLLWDTLLPLIHQYKFVSAKVSCLKSMAIFNLNEETGELIFKGDKIELDRMRRFQSSCAITIYITDQTPEVILDFNHECFKAAKAKGILFGEWSASDYALNEVMSIRNDAEQKDGTVATRGTLERYPFIKSLKPSLKESEWKPKPIKLQSSNLYKLLDKLVNGVNFNKLITGKPLIDIQSIMQNPIDSIFIKLNLLVKLAEENYSSSKDLAAQFYQALLFTKHDAEIACEKLEEIFESISSETKLEYKEEQLNMTEMRKNIEKIISKGEAIKEEYSKKDLPIESKDLPKQKDSPIESKDLPKLTNSDIEEYWELFLNWTKTQINKDLSESTYKHILTVWYDLAEFHSLFSYILKLVNTCDNYHFSSFIRVAIEGFAGYQGYNHPSSKGVYPASESYRKLCFAGCYKQVLAALNKVENDHFGFIRNGVNPKEKIQKLLNSYKEKFLKYEAALETERRYELR